MLLKNKYFFCLLNFAIISTVFFYVYGELNNTDRSMSRAEEFTYNSGQKRDPFYPLVAKNGRILDLDSKLDKDKRLNIEGIIYDEAGDSYVIVDGNIAKEGEVVREHKIISIRENEVELLKGQEEVVINFKKEDY